MERVKRYTIYHFIVITNGMSLVLTDIDKYKDIDNERFNTGNYFTDKDTAIATANKIQQIFTDNKNNN